MENMVKFVKNNYEKVLNIAIIILIINVIIYILFGSKALLNSDSSFIVDYSLEQIKTKSIFPKNWVNTNDFWIYSLIPLITIFLKFGISLFMSRQLSVLIQTIIFFFIIYDFFNNCFKDKKGFKMILLLLLSGISGQFFFEMYADATYGSIVFYMLLEIWLFIKHLSNKKDKKYLCLLGIILLLITSCSMRFPIYIACPFIIVCLYFIYRDGFDKKYIRLLFTILISTVIGFLINKYLCHSLIIQKSIERNVISDPDNLFENIKNTIFYYFWICGSSSLNVHSLTMRTYNSIHSSSPLILITFIRYIYAIITLLIPFIMFKKFDKMNDKEKVLYIFTTTLMFVILFFLLIGNMGNWYRYLIPVIFFMTMLYPMFYKYYFKDKQKNRIVFEIAIILFVISSFFLTTTSYFNIRKMKIRDNQYQELADFLVSKDLKFGYTTFGNEHNLYRVLTNNKLQVVRLDSNGKEIDYWLNSKDWFSKEYYSGKVFFMRRKTNDKIDLEKLSTNHYEVSGFDIFIFDNHETILDNVKK